MGPTASAEIAPSRSRAAAPAQAHPDDASPTPPVKGRALSGAVILIGEPSADPGVAMRASYREDGATNVIWRRTMKGVEEAIDAGGIAVAQIDVGLPGGDVVDLARRVRFGEIGDNPFLPIVITTASKEGRVVLAALLAGVDDVLCKPVSAASVTKRMHRIAFARKPFIAQSGYMGPVRAHMGRAFRDARQFVAPNALKAALTGQPIALLAADPTFIDARDRLTVLRLERCTRDIAAAGRGMLREPGSAEAADAAQQLLKAAGLLRRLIGMIPDGNLRDTVLRLAALTAVATGESAEVARATRLVVEIADAVSGIVEKRDDDVFAFPTDIIQRIDARFPGLLDA